MADRRKLASTEEMVEYFGISEQTLYDQRRRGVGVGALGFKVGKHLRFRWEDIDRWIDEQQKSHDRRVRLDAAGRPPQPPGGPRGPGRSRGARGADQRPPAPSARESA